MNAILESYSNLKVEERWNFLQWIRGKNPTLTKEVLMIVRMGLNAHGIYVPIDSLESYVRSRFDGMGPLPKAAFYQLCLDGSGGLLAEKGGALSLWKPYKERIIDEIFSNLDAPTRKSSRELLNAAIRALPPALEPVILSAAFAESGKGGSPEESLRLIFQRMGALVQKFGQNLAFDSHLPISYRMELQKLWDEGQAPDWWKVHELLHQQWGDIESAGFRLVKIRNSGSTEITLELEGPDQSRHLVSVQRESVEHGSDVDAQDLRSFVKELTKTSSGKKRYGFLSILVEDSHRTMKMELDTRHKSRMTPFMRENYIQSAIKIGATYQNSQLKLNGWTIESPRFNHFRLAGNRTLITQSIAPGIPMKDLQKKHPLVYKELSKTLLQLENGAQQNSEFPIDKDRMPGQVLVDLGNKTLTLLDHGQAKHVNAAVLRVQGQFLGAALTSNLRELSLALNNLGVNLSSSDQAQLSGELSGVEAAFRPLQALSWIEANIPLATAETQEKFWDLVHTVRASTRLAHWEQSIGENRIAKEWEARARASMSLNQKRAERILRKCQVFFSRVRRVFE